VGGGGGGGGGGGCMCVSECLFVCVSICLCEDCVWVSLLQASCNQRLRYLCVCV